MPTPPSAVICCNAANTLNSLARCCLHISCADALQPARFMTVQAPLHVNMQVFDYPTIQGIAEFVCQGTAEASDVLTVPGPAAVLKQPSHDQSFTVMTDLVTHSPGDALVSMAPYDNVRQVPLDRWDLEGSPEVATAARFGAFLPDADCFDAACFSISQAEAILMDPQQRLLLQAVGQASTTANQLSTTSSRHHGISIGIAPSDYASLLKLHTDKSGFHATANASSVACGRLSYTFGLKGPSMSIDTACSSSLVAVHLAHTGLLAGEAEVFYAAGVHLQCTAVSTSYVWAAGMLSASGRCQVGDAAADGYVRGEACCVVTLAKPGALTGSVRAVVKGSAVNQDGRSSSLTAPNGPSQQGVIRQALQASALEPSDIQALQLHGTG